MTTTLPTPLPIARAAARAGGRIVRVGGRWSDAAFWAAFGVVARYPKSTAVLTSLVTAATPVTLREVTGVVVFGSATAGMIARRGSSGGGTKPLAILSRLSTFRRRRRRIRRRWVTVMHDCGLEAASVYPGGVKRRPRLVGVSETAYGVRVATYAGNVSAGAADFRAKADRIRHGFGADAVTVSTHGRRILLDLRWGDPLAAPIAATKLPAPTKRFHVVVGLDEHGNPVEKDMRLPNLIVGAPGAGKSTEIWTTLRGLQHAGIPHRVRVYDPKGGIELGALKGRCHRYVSDASSWDTFLSDALTDMAAREERQAAAGIVKHIPTRDEPLDVMIVDELVTAALMGGTGSKVKIGKQTLTGERAFVKFLSSCRAAGFTVLAASQTAEKEVLGPGRNMFAYSSLLRVAPTETATIDIVLGSGAHKAYPAHEITPGEASAGVGWVRSDAGIVRYRAAYLTDAQRAQVARRMQP